MMILSAMSCFATQARSANAQESPSRVEWSQNQKPMKSKMQIELERATADLGLAHVHEMTSKAGLPAAEVRRLWSQSAGFKWLDEAAGYGVQLTSKEYFLLGHIKKILSVTPTCALGEMNAGLRKTTLVKGRNIPTRILEMFCRQMGLLVQSGAVSSPEPLDPVQILPEGEYELYTVLRQNDGVAHRTTIAQYFETKAISKGTFEITMTRAPILLKVEHRVWRLVGVPVDPDQVANVKQAVGPIAAPRDVSFRATVVGDEVLVSMPITARALEKGCGHIPYQWQEKLRGNYTLFHNGEPIAELHVSDPEVTGLQKAHRLAAQAAELIRIAFRRDGRTARIAG